MSKIKFNCVVCGKFSYQQLWQYKKSKHHFCSIKCRSNYLLNRIILKCNSCGKKYIKTPCSLKNRKHNFCCKKCYNEWQPKYYIREKHPLYKKVKIKCRWCNKIIIRSPHRLKNNKYQFCSNICKGLWRSQYKRGKNCYAYIHGQSKEPYPLEFNDKLKDEIRMRDGYKCHYPNCKTTQEDSLKKWKERLTIHHTDYNTTHIDPIRLISLCKVCNGKVNRDRDYWFAYFSYVLEEFYKTLRERKVLMKTEKEIKDRIKEVENSCVHLLKGDFADITTNAPRALMQLQTTSILDGLYFTLNKKRPIYEFEKENKNGKR